MEKKIANFDIKNEIKNFDRIYQKFLTDIINTTSIIQFPALYQCHLLFQRYLTIGDIKFIYNEGVNCHFVDMKDKKTQEFFKENKFDKFAILLLTKFNFAFYDTEKLKQLLKESIVITNVKMEKDLEEKFYQNLAITMKKVCCLRDLFGKHYVKKQQKQAKQNWSILTQRLTDKKSKEDRNDIINRHRQKQKKEKIKSLFEKKELADNKRIELINDPNINKIKTVYKWKNTANKIALKEKMENQNNKIQQRALKNLLKNKQQKIENKIQKENLEKAKTFHNWHIKTFKQKNEELKQKNKELQVRVNNLHKGYAMVNERNKKYKEELKKKITDVKNELSQLTKKKNKEIEDLKIQHEKDKKDIIQQCNKEANIMFHNAASDMSSKITHIINEEVIPNYNYYKNRYWGMYNDQMELKDKYTELLQQNNQLKDKIEQLKPKLNLNAKPFLPKNQPINTNVPVNNHINDNNLNTMSYFYQNQAFGGFVNGRGFVDGKK